MALVCFKLVQAPQTQSNLLLGYNTEHSVPVPLQHPITITSRPEGLFGLHRNYLANLINGTLYENEYG